MERFLESLMSMIAEEDGAVELVLFVTGICGLAGVGWAAEGVGCGRELDDDAGIAAAAAAAAAVVGGGTAAAGAAAAAVVVVVVDDDGDGAAGWGGGIASLCLHTAMREEGKKALVSHMVMTCITSVETRATKDICCKSEGGGQRGGD
jgi:hypothetical protein